MTDQGGKSVMANATIGPSYSLPTTTVNALHNKSSLYAMCSVKGVETKFLADTGAEISVLPVTHRAVPDVNTLQPISLQKKIRVRNLSNSHVVYARWK